MERGWERRAMGAVALVAVAAWVLRFLPFTREGGAFSYPIDYAEGIYYSASALFFQGHWPYRDFVFVHPPGSVLLWWPATVVGSWLGADTGFLAARWMATLCGAFSVLLVGRISLHTWGPVAGVVSALVYASFPETVLIERGPFLEPLLNFTCLSAANLWLAPPESGREERWWILAGVIFGLAISVKLVGGIWLIAALLSRPLSSTWNVRPQAFVLFAAGGAIALLWGPFMLQAPSEFFSHVFYYQAMRPADGDLNHMGRLYELFPERRLVSIGLALLGLVVVAVRAFRSVQPTRTAERFFAVAYVLTITTFLSSPSYWNQFNTFAASDSVLAGLGAAAIHEWLMGWFPHQPRLLAVLLYLTVLLPPFEALRGGLKLRAPEQLEFSRYIRETVPPDAPIFSFEPAWALTAGRLPPVIPEVPLVVDSYAAMLHSGMMSGERLSHATQTFHTSAAQRAVRELLARSRFVMLGWRGERQLSEESRRWFQERFIQRLPSKSRGGPDLWEQVPR
jgi:4-amino-4-deoxy-L-arabinose transferase-like glycosyltransferase